MGYNGEPIKVGDLGVPLFWDTSHIWRTLHFMMQCMSCADHLSLNISYLVLESCGDAFIF